MYCPTLEDEEFCPTLEVLRILRHALIMNEFDHRILALQHPCSGLNFSGLNEDANPTPVMSVQCSTS